MSKKAKLRKEVELTEPKHEAPSYIYLLRIYKKDSTRYDFKKLMKYLALEWDCTVREAILLSLKDAYEKLTNVKK